MKVIQLTRGYVAKVDDADYDALSRFFWQVRVAPKVKTTRLYAIRTCREFGKKRTIMMHRQIVVPGPDLLVDHVDNDGLNNTRANLRVCTASQNAMNRSYSDQLSGYRGVYFKPRCRTKPWGAVISVPTRGQVDLGSHATAEEAAAAYDRAALEHHGVFATLNFPDRTLRLAA